MVGLFFLHIMVGFDLLLLASRLAYLRHIQYDNLVVSSLDLSLPFSLPTHFKHFRPDGLVVASLDLLLPFS